MCMYSFLRTLADFVGSQGLPDNLVAKVLDEEGGRRVREKGCFALDRSEAAQTYFGILRRQGHCGVDRGSLRVVTMNDMKSG